MYYVKISDNSNAKDQNSMTYSEKLENDNSVKTANTGTIENAQNGERPTIGPVGISNTNLQNKSTKENNNNRYYYNKLENEAKVIYDAIESSIDNLKQGNYKINIDHDFSKLLNNESGQAQLKKYYDDAVNAINLDVPYLFYLDFTKMYLNIERSSNIFSTSYKLYIDSGDNANYFTDDFSSKEQVEIALSQIENSKEQIKVTLNGSDYSNLLNLHDWIINYMEYDANITQKATVYGGLIEKKGVCESYARIYKYILDDIGIENVLVTGTATNSSGNTEDHMWNYVKLNNNWYAVDVTWDDPIVVGNGKVSKETKHRYFLKGSETFFKNHTEKLTISSSKNLYTPPKLSISDY